MCVCVHVCTHVCVYVCVCAHTLVHLFVLLVLNLSTGPRLSSPAFGVHLLLIILLCLIPPYTQMYSCHLQPPNLLPRPKEAGWPLGSHR